MIQPLELKLNLSVKLSADVISTTSKLWNIILASRNGELDAVKKLVEECPELIYAQYNYTPPIHFAVREGHLDLVRYLLNNGAHDPAYKTYPFLDKLSTIAVDRGHLEIASLLEQYENDPSLCKFSGDNGEIIYDKADLEKEFQRAVNHNEIEKVKALLKTNPEFALDETASWSEGILMMPSNRNDRELIDLLLSYGARVPLMSKWGRAYYFKHYDMAAHLLEKGMNPNHKTWHHVTLLHDMAQEGNIPKAELLLRHGAAINPIEEEYQSTPLGMAARWGHLEMVKYLLRQGADPTMAGAIWSTPVTWARKKRYPEVELALVNAGAS